MDTVTYAHGSIADKTYPVTSMRDPNNRDEFAVGDLWHGQPITALNFYTGFAGCPPRYFITTPRGTYIHVIHTVMAI